MAELIFAGIILGMFGITALIFMCIGVYRKKKVAKAYRNNADLQKAKRDWVLAYAIYQDACEEYKKLMNKIDRELARRPYLTKVDVIRQDKELESLRHQLKKAFETREQEWKNHQTHYAELTKLREKYGIYGID